MYILFTMDAWVVLEILPYLPSGNQMWHCKIPINGGFPIASFDFRRILFVCVYIDLNVHIYITKCIYITIYIYITI